MEDILASIRRILSDEQPTPSPPPRQLPPEDDVLVLDASMMVPEASQPPSPAEARHAEPDSPEPQPSPEPPVNGPQGEHEAGLVGAGVAESAASSIKNLVRTVASERVTPVYRGGPTIEDIVREEIRPLLKEWLDRHLPPLVERLVRAEIERVVSRAAE
ncbi:MAG: DUF2497 domain-containing protein [Acidisphaera sp.]|nr:DUF2497 domain-containing protein [Acidisphaera sp.]